MTRPEIDKASMPAPTAGPQGDAAAREACVFYPVLEPGILRINGPDRADFLQRQTTNDLRKLSPGQPLTTILTSATGRVLDVLTLVEFPAEDPQAGGFLAITLPGRGAQTAGFLQKKIFFMDKVTVEDLSKEYRLFRLYGPGATTALHEAELPYPSDQPEVVSTTVDGAPVVLIVQPVQSGGGLSLVVPAAIAGIITARLLETGAEAIDAATAEILRVERGLAGAAGELNGDYTPLETNLDWAISDSKGCYTGQEVIARQITYDKVTRQLVGVKLGAETTSGEQVWVEGKAVGVITSFANSPRGGPLALAILKRPHNRPGTRVKVGESASGQEGEVYALPFSLDA